MFIHLHVAFWDYSLFAIFDAHVFLYIMLPAIIARLLASFSCYTTFFSCIHILFMFIHLRVAFWDYSLFAIFGAHVCLYI